MAQKEACDIKGTIRFSQFAKYKKKLHYLNYFILDVPINPQSEFKALSLVV